MNQAQNLINAWLKAPIFGIGYGTGIGETTKADMTRGYYELSYIVQLVQTGVVGVLIFAGLIFYIYRKLLNNRNKEFKYNREIIAYLTGFTSLLIATATNPYIYSFDGLWYVFYLITVVNTVLGEKNAGKKVQHSHINGNL